MTVVVFGDERGLDEGVHRSASLLRIVRRHQIRDRLPMLVERHDLQQRDCLLDEIAVDSLSVAQWLET